MHVKKLRSLAFQANPYQNHQIAADQSHRFRIARKSRNYGHCGRGGSCMSRNRKPPAYQEYAASFLASHSFRLATLEERGLWWTLRLECWENRRLPADPAQLAAILPGAFDVDAVRRCLVRLLQINAFVVDDADWLTCPELEDYRLHLEGVRQKQKDGGLQGAAKTNARKAAGKVSGKPTGKASSKAQVGRRVSGESLVQSSSVQLSSVQQKEVISGEGLSGPAWPADEPAAEVF